MAGRSALVATQAAYVSCGGCGHARIRHTDNGKGRCGTVRIGTHPDDPAGSVRHLRCECAEFVTPERH